MSKQLKKARLIRGISQTRLGKAAGINQSIISMIERGRYNPDKNQVISLVTALQKFPEL